MKTKIFFALACLGLTLNAQVTVERTIESFTKIDLSGAAKVYYTSSDTIKLKVAGGENEVNNTETKVEKGILFISTKGKSENGVSVYVSNKILNEILSSGASHFKSVNIIKSDSILNIEASGASQISAKVDAKKVHANLSGASNVHLSGNAESLDASLSGASVLKSYDLMSKSVNVGAVGASSAKVYASTKLVAKASGASSIKVKGEVKEIDAETSSAASITRILENGESVAKENGDSTTIRWKGKKVIIIGGDKNQKKHSYSPDFDHWAGFSLGVNGLLTADASTNMEKQFRYMDLNYSRCINIQLNPFQHNFHLYKNYINVVTGLGVEWRRYMLENKTTLYADSSFTWGTIDSTNNFKYGKNLLKSTMLQVPLLLEFNTHKKASKSFHIAFGAIGQFMINSKTKQQLERNGDEFTKINRDSYNMIPWNFKAHASIGYSAFTLFAEYNITPLFEKGEGPQLYPFVAGVRLLAF